MIAISAVGTHDLYVGVEIIELVTWRSSRTRLGGLECKENLRMSALRRGSFFHSFIVYNIHM